MHVAIVQFPHVPAPQDAEFRAWFDWSNQALAAADGLRGRRLLRADDGAYVAVVEHDTAATFAAMHESPVASQVRHRLQTVLSGAPQARTYELVSQALPPSACCGQQDGDAGEDAAGHPRDAERHDGCGAHEPTTNRG